MPTALTSNGQLQRIVDNESEFEQFVQEIEQYDYLMEDSETATQTRKYEKPKRTQNFNVRSEIQRKNLSIHFDTVKYYEHYRNHYT